MQTCTLAVDIGASSGRHIAGIVQNGKITLQEVYRFENGVHRENGHLCWDIDTLAKEVVNGLKAAHDAGFAPATIGIDTWAVDFVLLDADNKRIGDAVAYRDERTEGIRPEKLDAAVALLREKNPTATIVTTAWDSLTGEQILKAMSTKDDFKAELIAMAAKANEEHAHEDEEEEHEHHHHHDHDDDHDEHCCCGHHHDDDDDDEDEHEHHHHHDHDDDHEQYCCVQAITAPDGTRLAEFSKGQNSGWLFRVNNDFADVGMNDFVLMDGDEIEVLYTADYEKEPGMSLPYTDVSWDHWAYTAIKRMYTRGLMVGVNETTFAPSQEMSRAMLAVILYAMAGEPAVTGDGPFMRGFASRESIKGGTADRGICPLSEGQILFCWGRPGTSRKASAKEQLLRIGRPVRRP